MRLAPQARHTTGGDAPADRVEIRSYGRAYRVWDSQIRDGIRGTVATITFHPQSAGPQFKHPGY